MNMKRGGEEEDDYTRCENQVRRFWGENSRHWSDPWLRFEIGGDVTAAAFSKIKTLVTQAEG